MLLSKLNEVRKTLRYILAHPLNRDRKLGTLRCWLAWQVGSRLVPGPVAIGFVDGARLLVRPGMPGATGAVYMGLHEFEDMAFVLHALRPDDLFVDVGANVGSYTILAAAAVGARCLSFEPIAANVRHLEQNLRLNGVEGRVEVRNLCVGERVGRVRFTSGLDTANHVVVDGDGEAAIEVEVVALDEVLAQEARTLVVKIDVEGFELAVIRGARAVLTRPSTLAVVAEVSAACRQYGHTEAMFDSQIRDYGYQPVAYQPFTRALSPIDGVNPKTNNTLYVKDLAAVRARLSGAPRFHVHGADV